jgi:circadian clock protein KaiA
LKSLTYSLLFTIYLSGEKTLPLRLTIYAFVPTDSTSTGVGSTRELIHSLTTLLADERYNLTLVESSSQLLDNIEAHKEKIDCLLVVLHPSLQPTFNQLYEAGILLPVLIIGGDNTTTIDTNDSPTCLYHSAELRINLSQLDGIVSLIDQAIARFLHLAPNCSFSDRTTIVNQTSTVENKHSFLLLQQRRLAEKLKEGLGYLGVYYKRNPQIFYRNLVPKEKTELLQELRRYYREIILNYFQQDYPINQAIDEFVNNVFFTDLSVSQILEIHMELMDEFSQQLKLEGRSEEILLDYLLALIDILAHLGEMYRRSIPREDIPYDLLLGID